MITAVASGNGNSTPAGSVQVPSMLDIAMARRRFSANRALSACMV